MQNLYKNDRVKRKFAIVTYVMLFIFFTLLFIQTIAVNAASPKSCTDGYVSIAIGSQNSPIFRNDINIGSYNALSSQFTAGTNTNFSFIINSQTSLISLRTFAVGDFYVDNQINNTNGRINVNLPENSEGNNMIIIYAESRIENGNSSSCSSVLYYPLIVYHRPVITEIIPSQSISVDENEVLRFSIRVIDRDTDSSNLKYRWFNNSVAMDNNSSSVEWYTDYESEGFYQYTVRVIDDKGLYAERRINLTVNNVNRPPLMRFALSNIVLEETDQSKNLDLNVFFTDPDRDVLNYSYDVTYFEDSMNRTNFEDLLELRMRDQSFSVKRISPVEARLGIIVTATDPFGAYARSNVFVVDVFDFNISSRTLRATAECPITTVCEEWAYCTAEAIQTRQCMDTDCNGNQDMYLQKQSCNPEATCFDGIKNCPFGICEEDVDCGGPCEACRVCDHPRCMPIFCSGGCVDGHMCNSDRQCKSLNCEEYVCQSSTCSDGVRNQGEEGVDCGGVCDACPTCSDGVRNQGEEGVDCGGPCSRECVTLTYIIKNYWWTSIIISIALIFLILKKLMTHLRFLLRLVILAKSGRRLSGSKETLLMLQKRIAFSLENPYSNGGASKATYEGMLEEVISLLTKKTFTITDQSANLIKKEKLDFLTKKVILNLLAKAKSQETNLFQVAYPIMVRELRDVLDSYAHALAYEKKTTHL